MEKVPGRSHGEAAAGTQRASRASARHLSSPTGMERLEYWPTGSVVIKSMRAEKVEGERARHHGLGERLQLGEVRGCREPVSSHLSVRYRYYV